MLAVFTLNPRIVHSNVSGYGLPLLQYVQGYVNLANRHGWAHLSEDRPQCGVVPLAAGMEEFGYLHKRRSSSKSISDGRLQ
jgi:hypothetical protein